jgi:hypothetical protein
MLDSRIFKGGVMKFWNPLAPDKGYEERIANALERLVELKEIELKAKGLTLYTEEGEGEIFETDQDVILRKEYEDKLRAQLGLAPGAPVGVIDPSTGREWAAPTEIAPSWSSGPGYGFGLGPEGAESPEPRAEKARDEG